MTIRTITQYLESLAAPALQESYDNAGLLTGNPQSICTGVLCCLDATEAVLEEALEKNCNLVLAHHPIIFSGLKQITGKNYVERTIIKAIKNDLAIYALHTNLDNILTGVNGVIAQKLGLTHCRILQPKARQLEKLFFYVPPAHGEQVMQALFAAGGGQIGAYSECSFRINGIGSFLPGAEAHPFTGTIGHRHEAEELKIEILYPSYLRQQMVTQLKAHHPYEEVAYELVALENQHPEMGAGLVGELPEEMTELDFLRLLKQQFGLTAVKHTPLLNKPVKRISVCGGAGSFLLKNAINSKSDVYISSDFKYHEYFDADGQILIADIGHYESEQFTIEWLHDQLLKKFPNFAVLKTSVITNPISYF